MIVKTKLSEEERELIRNQYNSLKNIFNDFPNYVNRQGVQDNIRMLVDLFGEDFFD